MKPWGLGRLFDGLFSILGDTSISSQDFQIHFPQGNNNSNNNSNNKRLWLKGDNQKVDISGRQLQRG